MKNHQLGNKTIYQLPEILNRAIDDVDRTLASGNIQLTLDFSSCKMVSVEGVEWLEELSLRADALSSVVTFANIPPSIYKVFKVARIDSLLKAAAGLATSGPAC